MPSLFGRFGRTRCPSFILVGALFFGASLAQAGSVPITSSQTWTVPAGVTSITVEAWGGGGAGGGATANPAKGGGGAGGQYARKLLTVTPLLGYPIVVGSGGAGGTGNGAAGGDSIFGANEVVAKGGAGGTGATNGLAGAGSSTGGIGDVVYAGGNGSSGDTDSNCNNGGAGGGGAGSGGSGGSGAGNTAGAGTAQSGGDGGAGSNSSGTGSNGSNYGGGGGGACAESGTDRSGGNGAPGRLVITWADPPTVTTNAATLLTPVGATLNGSVNANGASTAVSFEYGLTTGYGSVMAATPSPVGGSAVTAVSAAVTGMTCATPYHFRVKAVSTAGTSYGSDLSFTPPCPAVVSINRASTNPTTANSTVSWAVTFNVGVTGVDVTDFALAQSGGAAGASITSVAGSGTSWTVTANSGTASSGTLGLTLFDDDSIVYGTVPLGGAGSNNGNFTGQTYTLVPPAVTLSKVASSAAAVIGDVVTFTVGAENPYGVALSDVVVTDTLPVGMTAAVYVTSLGSVTVSGQTLTWSIPILPGGVTAQMTLAVSLSQTGFLTNTVTSPGATTATASVRVLSSAVTHFKLDEPAGSWTGAAGEVIDSGGTALHGRRLTTSTPTTTNAVAPTPTIASEHASVVGGFCNAGTFDGRAVVEVADSPNFDYTTQLSATAWVYPTAYPSELSSILSNDTNYEFHLNPSGKLYWWWGNSSFTSATTVPLNQWSHIAITFNSAAGAARQRIYINGVLDANSNNWQGTLQVNNCNFYIGGDVATGSCALLSGRNFRGMIDEVKLYAYELDGAEVTADMTLGRQCSGNFDHIRIEHDGVASVCSPEQVVVKACMDANCSMLYPGTVTVRLSPTGWTGGDTFTFSGGVTSRKLGYASPGDVTLGVASTTPASANAGRCFNGATETCTLNFASTSCAFDAVETGKLPQTPIYTKLAGEAFSLDVLALSNLTTINPIYTGGPIAVDLVDASAAACPTGAGLNTATNISFVAGNAGRKPVSFTYANAAPNVKVRMKVGTSAPACSSDSFAIRPKQFTVGSSMNNTALTGTPKAAAGSAFDLTATSEVSAGYTGTPVLLAAKANDHNGADITASLTGTFAAGDGTKAFGNAFKYQDVGSIQLETDAVVDSAFTTVDQPNDCVVNSTSNALVSGKYGCNIGSVATGNFGRWHPSHFSFAGTLTPGCPGGGFTYMGDDRLGVNLVVKAHAQGAGAASASDPVTSRYFSGTGGLPASVLAAVTLTGDNNGTAVLLSKLKTPAFPAIPAWSAGLISIVDTFSFERNAVPASESDFYDAFKFKAVVVDPDGQSLIAPAETAATKIRYGRLRLSNVFGSKLSLLEMPAQALYWSGKSWLLNDLDSCTSIPYSAIYVSDTGIATAANEAITLAGGKAKIKLTPTTWGSVDVGFNLSNCNPALGGGTAAAMDWLSGGAAGKTCPKAKATFGVFEAERRKAVHVRELF